MPRLSTIEAMVEAVPMVMQWPAERDMQASASMKSASDILPARTSSLNDHTFVPEPNAVASAVLAKSTWAVLALTCHIELFVLAHYRESIEADADVSELWKDVFLYHAKEESQHAILDELEWMREDAKITPEARDAAVDDLIALVGAVDGILQVQSAADAHYLVEVCGRPMSPIEVEAVKATVLAAYRWQYIVSGVQVPRFSNLLNGMITPAQRERIGAALALLMA